MHCPIYTRLTAKKLFFTGNLRSAHLCCRRLKHKCAGCKFNVLEYKFRYNDIYENHKIHYAKHNLFLKHSFKLIISTFLAHHFLSLNHQRSKFIGKMLWQSPLKVDDAGFMTGFLEEGIYLLIPSNNVGPKNNVFGSREKIIAHQLNPNKSCD